MRISAHSVLKFLASLKLAVIVIIAIAILSGWGTIVESRYNSQVATKWVYHSPYMVITLTFLVINLVAVIVDRYPWKKHHLGFILAHIGIIITLVGSVVTKQLGIDGSLTLGIGQKGSSVSVSETDLTVWASYDGDSFAKLYERPLDILTYSPQKHPLKIDTSDGPVIINDSLPFAMEERKIVADAAEISGPALRFQLQNANVNLAQWIRMDKLDSAPTVANLGPAQIVLHRGNYRPTGENEIILRAEKGQGFLTYQIYSKRLGKKTSEGKVTAGDVVDTGWMDMKFRALKYLPSAKEDVQYLPREYPSEMTTAVLQAEFAGQKHWVAQNSMLKLFTDNAVYILSYGNRRIDIGFEMTLDRFHVGRYQGTVRAASYESDVLVPELGKINISMNEPLKHKGFTFYQASFHEDESGQPIASVLSVNKDPGRWVKYLGSLLIVLGTIVMFYFKRGLQKRRVP